MKKCLLPGEGAIYLKLCVGLLAILFVLFTKNLINPFHVGTEYIWAPLNKFIEPRFIFLVKDHSFKYQHAYSKVSCCKEK